MGWYTLNRQKDDTLQLQYATSELFEGLTVIESHRRVYTPEEKRKFQIDYDAVSYHAAKLHDTGETRALIILERIDKDFITYKPYTEQACPGEASCPRSILDKLTPTINEYSIEWRTRAYAIATEDEKSWTKDYQHGDFIRDDQGKVMGVRLREDQIKQVEKFENDHQTLWLAADKNGRFYTTNNRELKETSQGMKVEYDITVWHSISNERHCQITEEMHKVKDLINTNNQPNTIMEKKDEVKIKGYLGKEHHYKQFESGKSAITATIKPIAKKGQETQWVQFKAWETLAERIKDGIEKEGIKKLTITGKFKDVTFETKENGPKTIQEFQVSQIQKHKVMEISGTIDKVFEKETKNKKGYTELVVISDQVKDGNPSKEKYTVTLWNDKKNQVPKEVELKAGNTIAVKGEATILENAGATEKYNKIAARNIDKDLTSLTAQIETKIKNAQSRKVESNKSQAPSIQM